MPLAEGHPHLCRVGVSSGVASGHCTVSGRASGPHWTVPGLVSLPEAAWLGRKGQDLVGRRRYMRAGLGDAMQRVTGQPQSADVVWSHQGPGTEVGRDCLAAETSATQALRLVLTRML